MMINEKQKTVYSLIISQLRYDGFTDISSQLEDYTCIQTRPKNHLDKLVESFEHQWKITSFFADDDCIPTVLSKSASKDSLAKHSFNPDLRNSYSENYCFVSKSCSSNFNPFRECVTKLCNLKHAQITTHELDPKTDLPSINSNNSEIFQDGSDDISCDDVTLDRSSLHTDIESGSSTNTSLQSQYSTDSMNEFEEYDESSSSLVNESDDSVVDLTTDRVDHAVYKSNGLENVCQSPYLFSKLAKSGSEHADKAIPSPKCSSLQMPIKSTQQSSDEDTTEVSYSYSKNVARKNLKKCTQSSFSFEPTKDEIALIFEIFEGETMKNTAFRSNVDSIIPSIACCTVEHQLSVMLGDHVNKYFVISENEIRLKKYGKMTNSGLLSSISSILGKSGIETDFGHGLVSYSFQINPGNAKFHRFQNIRQSVAKRLVSGCDKVNFDFNKDAC